MSIKQSIFNRIDFLKGLLVLFVFLGHITTSEKAVYVIYTFHMPLFIGISGFLLSKKMLNASLLDFVKRIVSRMLIPWIIAETVYYLFTGLIGSVPSVSLGEYLVFIVSPSVDHLWFVIGMSSYMLITYVFARLLKNRNNAPEIMLAVFFVISLLSKLDVFAGLVSENNALLYGVYKYFRHYIRLRNLFFYVLGILFRRKYEQGLLNKKTILYPLSLLMFGALVYNAFNRNVLYDVILFFVLNICLLYICLQWGTSDGWSNKVMEFIGIYSFPIYLYHLLARYVAKFIFGIGGVYYYITCCVCFVGCLIVIYIGSKIPFVDRYFFGSTSNRFKNGK